MKDEIIKDRVWFSLMHAVQRIKNSKYIMISVGSTLLCFEAVVYEHFAFSNPPQSPQCMLDLPTRLVGTRDPKLHSACPYLGYQSSAHQAARLAHRLPDGHRWPRSHHESEAPTPTPTFLGSAVDGGCSDVIDDFTAAIRRFRDAKCCLSLRSFPPH